MAEFEETLNSILGNQEAMGQIMALARSLTGDGAGEPPAEAGGPGPDREEDQGGGEREPPAEIPVLPDLSAMLGQLDPAMIQMAMGLLRQYQSGDDRNTALLAALRPFLKEDRQARLDRAIQIARMTKLVRAALGAMGRKGEEGRV